MKQNGNFRISYHVSQQDYIDLLSAQYKIKRNRPLALALFLLSTLGQLTLVLYCVFSGMVAGKSMVLMLLLSCGLAAIAILNRCSYKLKARNQYSMLQKAGKSPVESGKRWLLEIDGEGMIHLDVDGKIASLDAAQILPVAYENAGIGLFSGNTMLSFVPEKVFASGMGKEELMDRIRTSADRFDPEEASDSLKELPEDMMADYSCVITKAEFLRWSRRAYRRMYLTKMGWPHAVRIRALLGVAAVGYAVAYPSWKTALIAVVLFLVLNFHLVRNFTPLINRAILASVKDLKDKYPGNKVRFSFGKDEMMISGSMHAMKIPYGDILSVHNFGDFAGMYLKKSLVLVVPKGKDTGSDEFLQLIKRIEACS